MYFFLFQAGKTKILKDFQNGTGQKSSHKPSLEPVARHKQPAVLPLIYLPALLSFSGPSPYEESTQAHFLAKLLSFSSCIHTCSTHATDS